MGDRLEVRLSSPWRTPCPLTGFLSVRWQPELRYRLSARPTIPTCGPGPVRAVFAQRLASGIFEDLGSSTCFAEVSTADNRRILRP